MGLLRVPKKAEVKNKGAIKMYTLEKYKEVSRLEVDKILEILTCKDCPFKASKKRYGKITPSTFEAEKITCLSSEDFSKIKEVDKLGKCCPFVDKIEDCPDIFELIGIAHILQTHGYDKDTYMRVLEQNEVNDEAGSEYAWKTALNMPLGLLCTLFCGVEVPTVY